MYEKIWATLEKGNIDVYAPGQHKGECVKPYVVIKDFGESEIAGTALNRNVIDIIIFAPSARYSQVEPFVRLVKNALKELRELKDTRYRSPIIIDEDKRAFTTSVRYERYLANK